MIILFFSYSSIFIFGQNNFSINNDQIRIAFGKKLSINDIPALKFIHLSVKFKLNKYSDFFISTKEGFINMKTKFNNEWYLKGIIYKIKSKETPYQSNNKQIRVAVGKKIWIGNSVSLKVDIGASVNSNFIETKFSKSRLYSGITILYCAR